jgi:peroxiredoxin
LKDNAPGEHAIPPEPITLDGSTILHQMMRLKWPAWKAMDSHARTRALEEAAELLKVLGTGPGGGSALFSLLGHKGDLMLIHFRQNLEELRTAQLQWTRLQLWDYCEYTSSYLSVVELGLYEASLQLYRKLAAEGLAPDSPPWKERVAQEIARLREAMAARLRPEIPPRRYLCFYPMDKRRGETRNWYELPIEQRQALMRDHGVIGRKYAGQVNQIISGSIGFDDWEWGVDLFADSPLVFKKLVYEMRFDAASAAYGSFGPFYLGIRVPASDLASLLS